MGIARDRGKLWAGWDLIPRPPEYIFIAPPNQRQSYRGSKSFPPCLSELIYSMNRTNDRCLEIWHCTLSSV